MPPSTAKARLFVQADLTSGSEIDLPDSQAHYVNNVMRLGADALVAVFNGRDGEWTARITQAGKRRCHLALVAQFRRQDSTPGPWLAFAPVKKARTDFIVEKGTELGVSRLWPIFTRHTATQRVNTARLRATAIEAAEQCGRLSIPDVSDPSNLDRLMAEWPADRDLLVLDETGGGRPLAEVAAEAGAGPPPGFLIGPEGGFARTELDELANRSFVTLVGLGPRILRAETAALSALACWQAVAGDWRFQAAP